MLREQYHCGDMSSEWMDLTYDSIPPLGLSLLRPIEFV